MNDTNVKPRLFNRYFILILLISFCLYVGQFVANSILALHSDSLGFSESYISYLSIVYMVLAIIARFVGGFVTDRLGRRWTMLIGCLIFAVSSYLYGVFALPFLLMALRGLQGVGFALSNTAVSTANVDVTTPEKLTTGVGLLWAATAAAMAIGSNIALRIIEHSGYMNVFRFISGTIACGTVMALFLDYERKSETCPRCRAVRTGLRLSDFVERQALPPALIILLQSMGFALTQFYLLLYASKCGIPNAGLAFTLMAAFMLSANLLAAPLGRCFGATPCIVGALGVFGVCLLLLGVWPSSLTYFAVGAASGLGCGIIPLCFSAALDGIAYARRGAASSTFYLSMDVGAGLGTALWGGLMTFMDFNGVFIAGGVTVLIGMLLALWLRRRDYLKS